MNVFNPLVSIVIPVYNGSNYLREAIDSALAQTYKNIEILVINDGSTDNGATRAIALSYGDSIRYFEKDNGGVVSALNFGIDHMNGEYFSWLSHDDLYLPRKIEKQITALLTNSSADHLSICVCNCIGIDKKGKKLFLCGDLSKHPFDTYSQCDLLFGPGFNGIMVLIPKALFGICGQFRPSLAVHEYDMWLRLMQAANIVIVSDYLALLRHHNEQITKQRSHEATSEIDQFLWTTINKISTEDIGKYFQKSGNDVLMNAITSYFSQQYYYACFNLMHKTRALLYNQNREYCTEMINNRQKTLYQFEPDEILKDVSFLFDALRNTYEQSTSWRITKPLRCVANGFRIARELGIFGALQMPFRRIPRFHRLDKATSHSS